MSFRTIERNLVKLTGGELCIMNKISPRTSFGIPILPLLVLSSQAFGRLSMPSAPFTHPVITSLDHALSAKRKER